MENLLIGFVLVGLVSALVYSFRGPKDRYPKNARDIFPDLEK